MMLLYRRITLRFLPIYLWLFDATLVLAAGDSNSINTLERIRRQGNLPGLVTGILRPDRSFNAEAVGVRKEGTPNEMTIHDDFHLGSLTKAMTATLLAILIDEGALTWNTTLAEALPDWEGTMHEAHRNTSLAMVTAHRTGISNDTWVGNMTLYKSLYNMEAMPGREEIMPYILSRPPVHDPNTTFLYSSLNYLVAGYVIDKHAGSWESVVRDRLWNPLNMTKCGFGTPPQPNLTAVENPWPHSMESSVPVPVMPDQYSGRPPAFGPAGTVHCSPLSYSKFIGAHMDGLKGRNTAILKAESFVRLHTAYPAMDEKYTPGGWVELWADRSIGSRWYDHTGTNTFNYAYVALVPRRNEAYMAFTNVGGPEALSALKRVRNEFSNNRLNLTQAVPSEGLRVDEPTQTGVPPARPTDRKPSSAQGVSELSIDAGIVWAISGLLCINRVICW